MNLASKEMCLTPFWLLEVCQGREKLVTWEPVFWNDLVSTVMQQRERKLELKLTDYSIINPIHKEFSLCFV